MSEQFFTMVDFNFREEKITIPHDWNIAPFMISHHDESSSWGDSPILQALVGTTVIILDSNGMKFSGDVQSVEQDGIVLRSALPKSGWNTVRLSWENINHIYYC